MSKTNDLFYQYRHSRAILIKKRNELIELLQQHISSLDLLIDNDNITQSIKKEGRKERSILFTIVAFLKEI